jgi:hypothetical protein
MIGIAITADAFDAVAAALASGGVLYEGERTALGGYFIWLDESVVNNLGRLQRSRDEDLSAVIVRPFGVRPTSRSPSCSVAKKDFQSEVRRATAAEIAAGHERRPKHAGGPQRKTPLARRRTAK